MMSPFRLMAATALLGALACTKPDRTPSADSAASSASDSTAAPALNTVTVTARDFAFDAPAQIPAGMTAVRLVNHGQQIHHVQIIRFDEGKTLADYQAAMKHGGPEPKWAVLVGGPNAPMPNGGESSAVLNLTPGNYAFACFVDTPDHVPHIMKGMAQAFTVTSATGTVAAEPTADVTMTLSDYDFVLSQPLTAGTHVIRVENSSSQPHEVEIVRLDSGKTVDDVLAWAKDYKGAPPGRPIGGMSGIATGMHGYITVDLPAGDYGMICFYPDMKDGKPHFMHGMKKQFKIS